MFFLDIFSKILKKKPPCKPKRPRFYTVCSFFFKFSSFLLLNNLILFYRILIDDTLVTLQPQ